MKSDNTTTTFVILSCEICEYRHYCTKAFKDKTNDCTECEVDNKDY